MSGKIEVRRMNGATWVKLDEGLAVVAVKLAEGERWFEQFRDAWREWLSDAVRSGRAVVGFGWKEAAE
jgi:hypothetical protein